jgi:hypothetical protein
MLTKDNITIGFNIIVHIAKGVLYACYMKRMQQAEAGPVTAHPKVVKVLAVSAHQKLRLLSKDFQERWLRPFVG